MEAGLQEKPLDSAGGEAGRCGLAPESAWENMLLEGERVDTLQYQGLRIIQKEKGFRFGTDSVLLADFASPKPGDRVVDMGTGTGILPILMASRQEKSSYVALEIQEDMAEMAARSIKLNGMEERIEVRACDFREAPGMLGYGKFTLAVCNPPYGKAGGAMVNVRDSERIARHEGECTVEDVAKTAAALLKVGGRLAVVYPAPRAFEMMTALREFHMEPKRIRTIHSQADREPKLVLMDAVKGGGSMLHWLPPLVLNNDDGTPSDEWKRIYRVAEARERSDK